MIRKNRELSRNFTQSRLFPKFPFLARFSQIFPEIPFINQIFACIKHVLNKMNSLSYQNLRFQLIQKEVLKNRDPKKSRFFSRNLCLFIPKISPEVSFSYPAFCPSLVIIQYVVAKRVI